MEEKEAGLAQVTRRNAKRLAQLKQEEAAREEAVAVAEAMKDGTTARKPISSKENVLIGRLFFNTRGLMA